MKQFLVQILLPVFDNEGVRFDRKEFDQVSAELTEKFGGATLYLRAPAEGLWASQDGVARDDVVVVEAIVDGIDEGWWKEYRLALQRRFRQREIVVRSQAIRTL